jgi:hypothetical protein
MISGVLEIGCKCYVRQQGHLISMRFCNYSAPFWLLKIISKGLPSFDKEGMSGSNSGPRQGWSEFALDCQSAAFRTTPSSSEGNPNPPLPKVLSSCELFLLPRELYYRILPEMNRQQCHIIIRLPPGSMPAPQ